MKIINRLLYRLTAGLPTRLIDIDGRPYLERYYLGQLFGATFYLHRFVSADTERHIHNHPWSWGRALVLSGSYLEERAVDPTPAAGESGCITESRHVRWWNRIDGNTFHRIAGAAPGTWTLCCHGPRVRIKQGMTSREKGWGFLSTCDWSYSVRFIPFPASSGRWWEKAPAGRDSRRAPL